MARTVELQVISDQFVISETKAMARATSIYTMTS